MEKNREVKRGLSNKSIANIDYLSNVLNEPIPARVIASALEITKYIIEKAELSKGGKIIILWGKNRKEVLTLLSKAEK
jgi:hypothetical protein